MTYVLVWILQPQPSIALGMILVSSCPAGHISNFSGAFLARKHRLSVSVSALSTVTALVAALNRRSGAASTQSPAA